MKIKQLYWKIPYDWRPSQIWYRLKCYFWHRYTTIKPRYLDHTWHDRCDILPHMMFEILSQFIEKECSPGHVDWDWDEEHRAIRQEMQELYDWWHQVYNKQYLEQSEALWDKALEHRPAILWEQVWDNPDDEIIYRECIDKVHKLDTRITEQLTDKLCRIIKLRHYMWT